MWRFWSEGGLFRVDICFLLEGYILRFIFIGVFMVIVFCYSVSLGLSLELLALR